jgi:hypothetical protein
VAAAPGDTVGLILDTARGGLDSLSSDLVSNGTFATDTVWSKGANWTIGSGVATKTGGAANDLTQTITSTAGLWYRITIDVTRTAGELTVSLGTSGTTRVINASGSYTFFVLAGSSTQTLTLAGDSAFAGTVDNVTARLVPGSHAYQTTSGSRPALARTPDGGRRNLLLYSEQFDNAYWAKLNIAITANAATAPDGSSTAQKLFDSSTGTSERVLYAPTTPTLPAGSATTSIYAKASEKNWIYVRCDNGTSKGAWFDLTNGVVGTVESGASAAISSVGSGWYRCSVTATITAGQAYGAVQLTNADNVKSYTGVTNAGVFIWGIQLETGSSATAYQRVGLTSDVTESGKRDCWGLLFDGSDDSLITASVDFSATDKMTVMVGVRKLSDAALGIIAELTNNSGGNPGFALTGPAGSASTSYLFQSRGTSISQAIYTNAAVTSPVTNVLVGTSSISGDSTVLRVNGLVAASDTTTDQGSGNYSNAALFFGRRNNGSLPFSGLIYTLVIRGATTPTSTIADFEKNLLRLRAGLGPF